MCPVASRFAALHNPGWMFRSWVNKHRCRLNSFFSTSSSSMAHGIYHRQSLNAVGTVFAMTIVYSDSHSHPCEDFNLTATWPLILQRRRTLLAFTETRLTLQY